jgi:hypothetical protein
MNDLEYQHFGPWIREISDIDPPSPLFLPYMTRQEPPLLSIKIPRKIESRNARPGMNLYDFLVSLYQHDLVILQRSGEKRVTEHIFRYQDIHYLRYSEELLKGTVRLGLRDNTFVLPFNTVSNRVMQRLVALIRERYGPAPRRAAAIEGYSGPVNGLSYYFRGLLRKKDIHEPQFCLLAAQADRPIAAYEPGRVGTLFHTASGKTLLESLHWSDGRELEMVTRGQDYKYRWQAVYAREYTYLPLEKISGFRWQDDSGHAAVSHLEIETAAGPLLFIFTADNPFIPPYTRFLEAAAAPTSGEEQLYPARASWERQQH